MLDPEGAPITDLAALAPDADIATKRAAVSQWLSAHRIEEVECVVPDLAGVARGKVMPAQKFADLAPLHLPDSIFFQTITGGYADFDGDNQYAENDLDLIPDLATLRQVPWAKSPTAQVIHDSMLNTGEPLEHAPRQVLQRIIALYAAEGWRPVVAPELEFYLTRRNTNPDEPLVPPVGRSGRAAASRQSYSISAVDEFDVIVDEIYDFAEDQGLEIDTIIQEGGASQLEINIKHGDPLLLADQAFLFKRTIREAALRNDCYATFMAKPMEDQPGSALHIHQSVVDIETGRSVFSDETGASTDTFLHHVGGMQNYLAAAMCILAPYVNSYRRLVPDAAAPINLEWGEDNRSVGLRVPTSEPVARRIENRVAGADTNPYLAIAVSLACGYLGMRDRIEPRQAIEGSAYQSDHGLPRGLQEALQLFGSCQPLQEALGTGFSQLFQAVKHEELSEYMRVISPWEREHLLLSV
ncbi:MAG: glutamine synthetase family protein [Pseudomonadota bacterium]